MRRKLLLNYLYICALSISTQFSSCLAQTAELSPSSSNGQVDGNEEHTVELKQNEGRISDATNPRIQRRLLVEKKADDNVRQVRRKRELRDVQASSARLRESSNPSSRSRLTSGEQRFKKSDNPMDQNSGKLIGTKNNAKINAAGEANVLEDEGNEDKRDIRKRQDAGSTSSLTVEDEGSKSGQKEAKRSLNSGIKPKSMAIKERVLAAQGAFVNENAKVRDNERHAALRDDAKAQKSESEDEQDDDEADIDEKSVEYEETSDDDKDNSPDLLQAGEESEKLDLAGSAMEEDDFEKQEIAKREADTAEEEYEDVDDRDGACDDFNPIDESSHQQTQIRPEAGLSEKKGRGDSRVKRHDAEASENGFEKNEAPNLNGDVRQELTGFKHLENVKEDPDDNSNREVSQTGNAALQKSSDSLQGENSKRQAPSENLTKGEDGNEEMRENSKRESRLKKEVETDNRDESNAADKSDVKLDRKRNGEEESKVAAETKTDVENGGKSLRQESNLDATDKNDESDSDYEKKIEEQIQQKIDSIKEEIKREVEEKQRVREIELNNAKYDEMQSEIEEDEDEDNQSLDIPNERKSVSKRSIIDEIRSPRIVDKRNILKRVKRSDTTDAQQLRAIEGVEKLDANVFTKAQLRHESIRKRSAPIYGAPDKDISDISRPLIKRSASPRRAYLVNNEKKRSSIPVTRDLRSTIIIPEQAHANIEDELPPGLSLDPSLFEDAVSPGKNRLKRSQDRFSRRRRASAVIPEGRVAFLGYRPQDDDEDVEGSEFDDNGFEDRTSNLEQDTSYALPRASSHDQYHADESRDENPANFLFGGIDRDRNDFLVRRKRAGIRQDQQPARLHGGGAVARRQTRTRAKQMQTAKINSRKNAMDRDKRQTGNVVGDANSDSLVSLVESSQELSPRLETEYREAFGGLQSYPSGALARFKRVKRDATIRGSLV